MASQKRISSYARLKKENEELRSEIYELVMRPNSLKSLMINKRRRMEAELSEFIYAGSYTGESSSGNGIFAAMIPFNPSKCE